MNTLLTVLHSLGQELRLCGSFWWVTCYGKCLLMANYRM